MAVAHVQLGRYLWICGRGTCTTGEMDLWPWHMYNLGDGFVAVIQLEMDLRLWYKFGDCVR